MSTDSDNHVSPAYFPFRALTGMTERMEREGLPERIDKSYVENLPWGYQNHFLTVLRAFGLTDAEGRPTESLAQLVREPENRPALIGALLQRVYPDVAGLSQNATQQQLEDEFRKMGISGDTLRKSIAFYLNAAKFAELPVSPHFKAPRASGNGRKTAARSKKNAPTIDPPPPPPPANTTDLHPYVVGWLKELPPMDGTGSWTSAKRKAWLDIVTTSVDMLITVDDEGVADRDAAPDRGAAETGER